MQYDIEYPIAFLLITTYQNYFLLLMLISKLIKQHSSVIKYEYSPWFPNKNKTSKTKKKGN